MTATSPLPAVEPTDASDTRWALQTALHLWNQGERRESLQWVRRAAEAAAEAGQDDRALRLAKMGAELRGVLEIPRTLPPSPPAEAPAPVVAPAPAVPSVSAAVAPAMAPAVPLSAPRPVSVPPSATPSSSIPPPSLRGESELVVTVVATNGSIPAPDASLVAHRAIRVLVTPGASESDLKVRKLRPGEVAPRGGTVAILVALEPGASPVPEK